MNFTWEVLVFTFVSGMVLVLIPSIVIARKKNTSALTAVEWLDNMELSGVALISKLVVLVAPVPVAITTKIHAAEYLPIGEFGAWILAFVVEGLGYAAAYRLLQFIQYNKNLEAQRQIKLVTYATDEERLKKAEARLEIDRKKSNAPVRGPAIVYAAYLIVVIIFNVLPEAFGKENEWWKIAMNVCVALLSAPAAYLGAINAVHTEQKAALLPTSGTPTSGTTSGTRLSKPLLKVTSRTPASRTPTSGTNLQPMGFQKSATSETKTGRPSIHQERVYEYMEQVYKDQNRVASFAEVERDLELPQSTASRLRNSWVDKNTKGEQ